MGKVVVVGTGFSGSILAREIAEKLNREVLVLERRNHIAGNMFDEYDENGILIQRYGPHFLNTNKYFIIKYLKRYAELIPHDTKLLSFIDGKYVQLPFNFKTLKQLVGDEHAESLLKKMRKYFTGRDRVPIFELMECEDQDVRAYADLLFDKAYKTYVAKQWGLDPNEIDKSVIERTPMAMNYDERYLNKDFQYLPKKGFTELFKELLNHEKIEVKLGIDALDYLELNDNSKTIKFNGEQVDLLIFTGAIDELFKLKYGRLPYRSLNITYEYHNEEKVLPSEIVSYPQAKGFTRQTEYKQFTFNKCNPGKTVIATEYPLEYDPNSDIANTPYYPTLTKESMEMYEKYKVESEKYGNIILCGRLAEFRYYNMDVCIEHALEKFEEVKKYLEEN